MVLHCLGYNNESYHSGLLSSKIQREYTCPCTRTISHWNSLSPSLANTQATLEFRALLTAPHLVKTQLKVVFFPLKMSNFALPGIMFKIELCRYLRVLPVLNRADVVGIFIFVGVNTI